MKLGWSTAVALMVALAPAASLALEPSPEVDGVPWTRAEQNRVFLEHDIWGSEQFFGVDMVSLGWTVVGQFRVVEGVFIDAEIPWGYWNGWTDNFSDDGFAFGNLTVGAHYAASITEDIGFWAGGRVAVPTQLMDVDDVNTALAAGLASSARGGLGAHRFFAEHISLPFGGGVELRFAEVLYFRATLLPAMHIPVDGDFEFFMDQGNELEVRADMGFGGGLRLQEVFMFSQNDKIQTALEPFIGYESPGAGFIFRLGFMLALDENLGFGFEQGKVAAVRTMFGGKF